METRLVLLLLSIFATLTITLLISYASNVKKSIKVAFWSIFLGTSAWQANIYIGEQLDYEITAVNLVFLWPPVAIYATAWFIALISGSRDYLEVLKTQFIKITSVLFGLQILITLTNKILTDVNFVKDEAVFERGPLYFVYVFTVLLSISAVLIKLFNTYAKHKQGSKERKAVQIVLITLSLALIYAVITNVVLPVLINSQKLIGLGAFTSVIFALGLYLSVTKYKFLDIRLIVARSVAYVFSIGLLIAAYSFLSSLITAYLDDAAGLAVDAAIVASAILSYPFFKSFFDKATNRIFYRDAYDPEAFLDELNSSIVGNIELGILLRHTTAIIQKNLKCEHCFIEILPTPTTEIKVIGVGTIPLDKEERESIKKHLAKSGKKVVITDNLGPEDDELKNLLSRKDIGVISSLKTSSGSNETPVAHMMLGPKKSGNIYNKQDLKIIEIISDELNIAIQNALRFEEIQGFAAKLQAEVNTATAKLQRTNKKLRELDETKDEFISMASHQLRTPLTSVKGYMSMVLEGDAGKISKQQRELLNQAFVSSQRMVYLIADLLNVSRLKTGKFIIEATPTNLAEVIEGEIGQLRETAKAKKIEIEYQKPKDFPTLSLDETKIRQVIMNFADNAIYYTPRGGKIKVELSEDKSNVYFKVIDNGLGVPKADKPRLFSKFYRASNARKARPDGTGLGLFMAKKVIDSQGGNILFESEENQGSTFGFCFDKKKHMTRKHAS